MASGMVRLSISETHPERAAQWHPDNVLNMGALHQATLKRAAEIEAAGYILVSIWESDWTAMKRKISLDTPV